ncbi:30S ribosomal protein S18 [Patescibacteria group bacterium]|nr:30S ribosomal protein S18 [Patescibacteria group bacterium]MCL5010087.1 30S ribosomal protein S18 [Patescibacteria group bacterium]
MKKRSFAKRPRKNIKIGECFFCKEKKNPWFSDYEILRRFITDRGKIIGRTRSGVCAKHQRKLTRSVKQARHLALLPFRAL